jgi:AAA domain-containing protein
MTTANPNQSGRPNKKAPGAVAAQSGAKRNNMNDDKPPTQNKSSTDDDRHFLEAFYSGVEGVPELRRMTWDNARRRYSNPESLFSTNMSDLVRFATTGRGDVFHGVSTRKPGEQSGIKENCFEALGIHTDVDFKETPEERFKERLEAFPHKPTIIVYSGNGAHGYWLFENPLRIDDSEEKRDFIEAVNRGVAKAFGGDDIHDITRVLRTPGRPNSKYDPAPMCRIQSNGGPRYDIYTLADYAIKTGPKNAKVLIHAIPEDLPEKFRALLAKNKKIQDTWNGQRPDLKDQSRSGHDMALADLLVIHGFAQNEAAAVLKQFPYGKGADASDAYLERTISKATSNREGGREFVSAPIEKQPCAINFPLQTWKQFISTDHDNQPMTIEGVAPDSGLIVFHGRGKDGKTTALIHAGRAIASGQPFLDRQSTPKPVIYVNYEMGFAYLKELLAAGGECPQYAYILNRPEPILQMATIEALMVGVKQPGVMVVDSFRGAFRLVGDAENSAGGAGLILRNIQDIAVKHKWLVVVVHHRNRSAREGTDGISGTSDWIAAPDVIWTWSRPDKSKPGILSVEGRLPPVEPMAVDLSPTQCVLVGTVEESRDETDKKAILAVLTAEGQPATDIAEAIKAPVSSVRKRLESLFDANQVNRGGEGKRGDPFLYSKINCAQQIPLREETNLNGERDDESWTVAGRLGGDRK